MAEKMTLVVDMAEMNRALEDMKDAVRAVGFHRLPAHLRDRVEAMIDSEGFIEFETVSPAAPLEGGRYLVSIARPTGEMLAVVAAMRAQVPGDVPDFFKDKP